MDGSPPFQYGILFPDRVAFSYTDGYEMVIEEIESKEQRRRRIKTMRTIVYYLIRMTR